MRNDLIQKYNITVIEAICCKILRLIRGTNKCPRFILKYSIKKYGFSDNVGRYWHERFYGTSVGKYSYGYCHLCSKKLVSIGNFCSIALGTIIVPNDHRVDWVTTSPVASLKVWGFAKDDYMKTYITEEDKKIFIGNDVWIGANCIIFEGVTIGDGAIIAAGSVIRKNVPPYAVVGGVDKILKYRFDDVTIEQLLRLKWWDWDDEIIRKNIRYFHCPKTFMNVAENIHTQSM